MGIIILLASVSAVCITIAILAYVKCWHEIILSLFGIIGTATAGTAVILIGSIIFTQATEQTTLYELKEERASLVDMYNDGYDGYTREEIADFNIDINKNNHYHDSFWTKGMYIDCTEIEPITIKNGIAK